MSLIIVGVQGVAHAQPQDDAALANVRDDSAARTPNSRASSVMSEPGWEPAAHEEEAAPPLTTAELRQTYPDLELRTTPPLTLTISLTSIYPLQTLGLGLGLDAYALPRLRLTAIASPGASVDVNGDWRASFYGEAGFGIAVLRWLGETIVRLPSAATKNFRSKRTAFERFMFGDETPPDNLFLHAPVPASHSLELEAGAFSGHYPLYRCIAHCNDEPRLVLPTREDASRQLLLFYAGVRYVYYRSARSERARFRSSAGVDVAVDAIHNPFTPSDANLFNLYERHPAHNPVGVRVKLRIPAVKCTANGGCLGFDIMGGYLPNPADALVSVNLTFQ